MRGIQVESRYPRNLTTEFGYEIRNIDYLYHLRVSFVMP